MEFLAGPDGAIIPSPDQDIDPEQVAKIQSAMRFFSANADRVLHFQRRAEVLGLDGRDTVITLINVDDAIGGILAAHLMPGEDWQQYRDAGEVPVARGLARKDFIQGFLAVAGFNIAAAGLQATETLQVVVLDAGLAHVLDPTFEAPDAR